MKKMKKIRYIVPLILLFAFIGSAAAQSVDSEKIDAALRWTDRLIEQARQAVEDSRSMKARVTLQKAIELQNRARERAGNLSSNASRLAAFKYTRAAREEAKHAIALARTETRLAQKARRIFERTSEKIRIIGSMAAESGIRDMRVEKFILDARAMLERAHTNYSQTNNRSALKLAEKARNLADQAEKRYRRLNKVRNTCTRKLQFLERLTLRASRIVERRGDLQARKQLSTAKRQLGRARTLLAEGRYHACNSSIDRSEKLMRSLIRRLNSPEERSFEEALDRGWYRLEKAKENSGGSEKQEQLLERARKLLRQAEDNYLKGKAEAAQRLLERAMQILQLERKEKKLTKEFVSAEYEKVAGRRERIRNLVESCGKQEARALFQRAVSHLDSARKLLAEGKLRAAYSELRIARNLFNRVSEIC